MDGRGDAFAALALDVGGERDQPSAAWALAGVEPASLEPVVDDVGVDGEGGGDLGDGALVRPGGLVVTSRAIWVEPATRSRQARSVSGPNGTHSRPLKPRRAASLPPLIHS